MAISALWFRSLDDRSELDGNRNWNRNLHYDNRVLGIAFLSGLLLILKIIVYLTFVLRNYKCLVFLAERS